VADQGGAVDAEPAGDGLPGDSAASEAAKALVGIGGPEDFRVHWVVSLGPPAGALPGPLLQITLTVNKNNVARLANLTYIAVMARESTKTFNISAGERIRAARVAAGLTQEALAREVGVTRSAVAQWETDRAGQIGGNLARIAEILGVSVGHLLTGVSSEGGAAAEHGTELALLRLYRTLGPEDRALIMRTAARLARQQRKARAARLAAAGGVVKPGQGAPGRARGPKQRRR
jgi:transcriptional regulator with XRE-family HTH domain